LLINLIAPVSDQEGLVSCEQFLLEGIRLWGYAKRKIWSEWDLNGKSIYLSIAALSDRN
jgi:hypothetical protein